MTALATIDVPPLPIAVGKMTLTAQSPAVRLSAVDSDGGSLLIAGSTNAYVEDVELTAVQIGTDFRAPGRRRLATKRGRDIIVHLDRVKMLRRVVVAGDSLVIVTGAGSTILVPGPAHVGIHVVMTESGSGTVRRHLEVRRDDATGPLADAYGMELQE